MPRNSRRNHVPEETPVPVSTEPSAAPATPPAPTGAPVDQIVPGTVVEDLRGRLVDLQSTVERLVSQADQAAAVDPAMNDPEIQGAARTLRFAQQTADQVIAEAKDEAVTILADAERQRTDILQRAEERAEVAFGEERDRVKAASAAWEADRADALLQLDALSSAVRDLHQGFTAIDTALAAAAARLRGEAPVAAATPAADVEPVHDSADAFVFDVTELPPTAVDLLDTEHEPPHYNGTIPGSNATTF